MITIIDYDAGNIKSITNMLRALGVESKVSSNPSEIETAERLILPGVGHYDYGMKALKCRGLVEVLNHCVVEGGIPILGICLGAQLLTNGSEEGNEPGLGWIEGSAVSFDRSRLGATHRVPHMGWADTWALREGLVSIALPPDARFYYVHSFHIVCNRKQDELLAARHGYKFTAGVQRDNILGVQFHPEKSHRFGMQLLQGFLSWTPSSSSAML